MKVLTREHIIYSFSESVQPAITIDKNEELVIETHDCFTGQIKSERDLITEVDFSRVNPATGPVGVNDAFPGDILVLEIVNIEVDNRGFMVTIPGEGGFGDRISSSVTKLIEIKDEKFFYNNLAFPVSPMVGVIGVCPESGEVPCGEIGSHGGNLDAKVITKGSKVYFLVRRDGALFALGDLHAGMGDGEAVICGVETPGRVTVKAEVIKNPVFKPERPLVETGDKFVTIGIGADLDEAVKVALDDMLVMVQRKLNISAEEGAMLISAVGDVKVCQIVDPQKTARVEMPKDIFEPVEGLFF